MIVVCAKVFCVHHPSRILYTWRHVQKSTPNKVTGDDILSNEKLPHRHFDNIGGIGYRTVDSAMSVKYVARVASMRFQHELGVGVVCARVVSSACVRRRCSARRNDIGVAPCVTQIRVVGIVGRACTCTRQVCDAHLV